MPDLVIVQDDPLFIFNALRGRKRWGEMRRVGFGEVPRPLA